MTYNVYVISNNGDGRIQRLPDWDGSDNLTFHLNVFAPDAVIEIEPNYERKESEDA